MNIQYTDGKVILQYNNENILTYAMEGFNFLNYNSITELPKNFEVPFYQTNTPFIKITKNGVARVVLNPINETNTASSNFINSLGLTGGDKIAFMQWTGYLDNNNNTETAFHHPVNLAPETQSDTSKFSDWSQKYRHNNQYKGSGDLDGLTLKDDKPAVDSVSDKYSYGDNGKAFKTNWGYKPDLLTSNWGLASSQCYYRITKINNEPLVKLEKIVNNNGEHADATFYIFIYENPKLILATQSYDFDITSSAGENDYGMENSCEINPDCCSAEELPSFIDKIRKAYVTPYAYNNNNPGLFCKIVAANRRRAYITLEPTTPYIYNVSPLQTLKWYELDLTRLGDGISSNIGFDGTFSFPCEELNTQPSWAQKWFTNKKLDLWYTYRRERPEDYNYTDGKTLTDTSIDWLMNSNYNDWNKVDVTERNTLTPSDLNILFYESNLKWSINGSKNLQQPHIRLYNIQYNNQQNLICGLNYETDICKIHIDGQYTLLNNNDDDNAIISNLPSSIKSTDINTECSIYTKQTNSFEQALLSGVWLDTCNYFNLNIPLPTYSWSPTLNSPILGPIINDYRNAVLLMQILLDVAPRTVDSVKDYYTWDLPIEWNNSLSNGIAQIWCNKLIRYFQKQISFNDLFNWTAKINNYFQFDSVQSGVEVCTIECYITDTDFIQGIEKSLVVYHYTSQNYRYLKTLLEMDFKDSNSMSILYWQDYISNYGLPVWFHLNSSTEALTEYYSNSRDEYELIYEIMPNYKTTNTKIEGSTSLRCFRPWWEKDVTSSISFLQTDSTGHCIASTHRNQLELNLIGGEFHYAFFKI